MKNLKTFFSMLCAVLLLLQSNRSNAQLLKRILNDAKNTAESRADQKTDQVTNKALDKVDNSISGKNKSNNTALLNTTGSDTLSAADSNKIISAFKNKGNSGNARCVYFEVTMNLPASGGHTINSVIKYWFTGDGRGRSEMNMASMIASAAAGYQIDEKPIVALTRASQPNYIITLNGDDKTYSFEDFSQPPEDNGATSFSVHEYGQDKINGYNCKHIFIQTGDMNLHMELSTGVPGYAEYKKSATIANSADPGNYMSILRKSGYDGYPVKIFEEKSGVTLTLTKAIYVSVSNNFFDIPSGYQQTKDSNTIKNLMEAGQ